MLNCAGYIFISAPWIHVPRSYFLLSLARLDSFALLSLLHRCFTHSVFTGVLTRVKAVFCLDSSFLFITPKLLGPTVQQTRSVHLSNFVFALVISSVLV